MTATGARYHPALIAQAWMTLERMFPGRPFLGIGSDEALTEEGRFYRLRDCKLHTLADRKPPIWVSAFGPQAA